MELIRERIRAVRGTEGSGSDNSKSLETPQLDPYPGNLEPDSARRTPRDGKGNDRKEGLSAMKKYDGQRVIR